MFGCKRLILSFLVSFLVTSSQSDSVFFFFQWEQNREKLTQQANIILTAIQQHTGEMHKGSETEGMPSTDCIDKLLNDMSTSFDEEYGGYGGAPKFPQACE